MAAPPHRPRAPREEPAASEACIAGCVAGSIGQLMGFPLDTLKVRTQLQTAASVSGLFSGWRVPVATAGAINCVNFGTYDYVWRHLSPDVEHDVDASSAVVFAAGTCGGLVVSPMTTVVSRIKVLQQAHTFPGRGVLDVFRGTVEGGGLRCLWCGFSANFAMECCRGFYMLFFVGAKRYLGAPDELPLWKRSLAGAFAGVASWIIVYPLDVVKTAVQAQNPLKGERTPTLEMAARLYRDGGVRRFYRGLGFTVLRAGPVAGVLLPTFDLTLYGLRALR
jgi:solute carrier family 25 carnitine/acylcarnitine transporter 20/29